MRGGNMRDRRWLVFWLGILLLASWANAQTRPATKSATGSHYDFMVVTNVTVINPGTSSVEPGMTVVITENRITSVSRNSKFARKPEQAAVLVDGRGKFLLPGLWDMHVHSAFGDWFPGGKEIILPL